MHFLSLFLPEFEIFDNLFVLFLSREGVSLCGMQFSRNAEAVKELFSWGDFLHLSILPIELYSLSVSFFLFETHGIVRGENIALAGRSLRELGRSLCMRVPEPLGVGYGF